MKPIEITSTINFGKYSWTRMSPFRLDGPTSRQRYGNLNVALNACIRTKKCAGVTKESNNDYRLNTGSTAVPARDKVAYIKGGTSITTEGYSWSEYDDYYIDTRLDNTDYDALDVALKACAEKKGKCKGVVQTDKNKYYLVGGKGTKTKKIGYTLIAIGGRDS